MSDSDKEFLRLRLSSLRTNKGVSEKRMSEEIGRHPAYIRDISTGKSLPSMENFFNICRYFGLTPAEFFDENINNPLLAEQVIHNVERVFGIDADKFLKLLEIMEPEDGKTLIDFIYKLANKIQKQR